MTGSRWGALPLGELHARYRLCDNCGEPCHQGYEHCDRCLVRAVRGMNAVTRAVAQRRKAAL